MSTYFSFICIINQFNTITKDDGTCNTAKANKTTIFQFVDTSRYLYLSEDFRLSAGNNMDTRTPPAINHGMQTFKTVILSFAKFKKILVTSLSLSSNKYEFT